MSGGADALLKGMLGIGVTSNSNNNNNIVPTSSSGKGGGNKTTKKKKAQSSNDNNISNTSLVGGGGGGGSNGGKVSRGKTRAGSQGRRRNSQQSANDDAHDGGDGGGGDDVVVAVKSKKNTKKKKKNKGNKQHQGSGEKASGGEETKTITPSSKEKLKMTKKHSSSTQNATNYAWSAFQSSPDPSSLPDIGGLFGDNGTDAKEDENETRVEDEPEENPNSDGVNSSSAIRNSIDISMLAKKDAGQALLQSLNSPDRKRVLQAPRNVDGENTTSFRRMKSIEAEMIPSQETDTRQEEKTKVVATAAKDTPGTTQHQQGGGGGGGQQQNYQYADPIMQLMNPGLVQGGFGIPPQHHYHTHPQMPYHQPLHYPNQYLNHPMQQQQQQYQSHHQYPPSQPQMHHPHPNPYHQHQQQHSHQQQQPNLPPPPPSQPQVPPPGFTTMQVRVPDSLGPGNTMMVRGMSVPVPPGASAGAIIPIMVPIHPPGQQQQHGYFHQRQVHQTQQQQLVLSDPNSWAAKAKQAVNKTKHKVGAASSSKQATAATAPAESPSRNETKDSVAPRGNPISKKTGGQGSKKEQQQQQKQSFRKKKQK